MRSALVLGLVALALGALVPDTADAKPRPGVKKGFRLFARATGALTINRIYCGLTSKGEVCVDSTNSPVVGGGFWPKGTADQYVFNSGMQVAGIIGPDANPEWVGDTTGGQLFSPRGDDHGDEIQPIYNANNPDDVAEWPEAANVPLGDATQELFDPLLRGRVSASQGDVWFVSWEGNPGFAAGREHPLGILVEQRGLGYNFPTGNEDILYFIYTFYNITSSDPAVYGSIRPGMREVVAGAGAQFQLQNEGRFGIDIPDGGYTITNMFAAFGADMDVAEAGSNYASVNVPFSLGYTYELTFSGVEGWTFDPTIFGPPFFPGSGFVGVKYLKSPVVEGEEVGLTLFSNTINGGAFDDAQNATQLYRYLSNNISTAAGDAACNTGNPQETRICYINNGSPDDMRFFQSSGPLELGPGQFGSIVVAYIFAAPVAVGACTGPGTCTVIPGDPRRLSDAAQLASAGANQIDSVTGFTGFTDANGDGEVQQDEINTVPGSLLDKAKVAQLLFDNRFLSPGAPEGPPFFLIPGNSQVTVVWTPSSTETVGDPYFQIASSPTIVPEGGGAPVENPLYDPNYRELDVEGYRVYRGRVDSPTELTMLAQFDKTGTVMPDFTSQVNPVPGCAPELGINAPIFAPGTDSIIGFGCPVEFDSLVPGTAPTVSVDVPLVGTIVQVQRGDRLTLATGQVTITAADTALTGAASDCPEGALSAADCPLRDTGVPFAFVDRTARNNLRYFYSVTAFDINSLQSGPSSIESSRSTKSTTPIALASNYTTEAEVVTELTGRGTVLETGGALPTIDPANGTFSGPFPPATGWSLGLGVLASQVLSPGEGTLVARLDSIQLGSGYQLVPHQYWFTASASGSTSIFSVGVLTTDETGVAGDTTNFRAVPVDANLSSRYGGNSNFLLPGAVSVSLPGTDYLTLFGRGCVNGRDGFADAAGCAYNGSRWFAGPSPEANETVADPIACNTGNFSNVPMACFDNAGGGLPGVETIHQTQCYQSAGGSDCRPLTGIQAGAKRAADLNVYWGAGGVIDSVIDVTHNVVVPFDTLASGGWGILNPAAAGGASPDGSATLTNKDFACVEPIRTYAPGGFLCPDGTPAYQLSNTAAPGPVGFFSGGAFPPTVPIVAAANAGFGLYIAGDMFTFELTGGAVPAAGAVWALRQYIGAIQGGQGAGGDYGPYQYSHPEEVLPLTAVGTELRATYSVTNNVAASTANDLSRVHTVPDPYYVTSAFEQTTDSKIIKFVNLPVRAIIRIYSSSGVLVSLLEHNSNQFGGSQDWNVRNRNNQVVASGVYFYHIEAGDARRVGRFTVVNFAQ
jgi:hypothetical protein